MTILRILNLRLAMDWLIKKLGGLASAALAYGAIALTRRRSGCAGPSIADRRLTARSALRGMVQPLGLPRCERAVAQIKEVTAHTPYGAYEAPTAIGSVLNVHELPIITALIERLVCNREKWSPAPIIGNQKDVSMRIVMRTPAQGVSEQLALPQIVSLAQETNSEPGITGRQACSFRGGNFTLHAIFERFGYVVGFVAAKRLVLTGSETLFPASFRRHWVGLLNIDSGIIITRAPACRRGRQVLPVAVRQNGYTTGAGLQIMDGLHGLQYKRFAQGFLAIWGISNEPLSAIEMAIMNDDRNCRPSAARAHEVAPNAKEQAVVRDRNACLYGARFGSERDGQVGGKGVLGHRGNESRQIHLVDGRPGRRLRPLARGRLLPKASPRKCHHRQERQRRSAH